MARGSIRQFLKDIHIETLDEQERLRAAVLKHVESVTSIENARQLPLSRLGELTAEFLDTPAGRTHFMQYASKADERDKGKAKAGSHWAHACSRDDVLCILPQVMRLWIERKDRSKRRTVQADTKVVEETFNGNAKHIATNVRQSSEDNTRQHEQNDKNDDKESSSHEELPELDEIFQLRPSFTHVNTSPPIQRHPLSTDARKGSRAPTRLQTVFKAGSPRGSTVDSKQVVESTQTARAGEKRPHYATIVGLEEEEEHTEPPTDEEATGDAGLSSSSNKKRRRMDHIDRDYDEAVRAHSPIASQREAVTHGPDQLPVSATATTDGQQAQESSLGSPAQPILNTSIVTPVVATGGRKFQLSSHQHPQEPFDDHQPLTQAQIWAETEAVVAQIPSRYHTFMLELVLRKIRRRADRSATKLTRVIDDHEKRSKCQAMFEVYRDLLTNLDHMRCALLGLDDEDSRSDVEE